MVPEGITLIPEGLYPDYPPPFQGEEKEKVSVLSYVLKLLGAAIAGCGSEFLFGFLRFSIVLFSVLGGFWAGFCGFCIICCHYRPN